MPGMLESERATTSVGSITPASRSNGSAPAVANAAHTSHGGSHGENHRRKKLSHVGFAVHDQDADTHDAASSVVVWRVRGSRTANSVNSPTRLSTVIVPPCCWVTMS